MGGIIDQLMPQLRYPWDPPEAAQAIRPFHPPQVQAEPMEDDPLRALLIARAQPPVKPALDALLAVMAEQRRRAEAARILELLLG